MKTVILIFVIGVSTNTKAQDKNIKRANMQWIQYYAQMKIKDRWTWSADGGYRLNGILKSPGQYIVRTGLAYRLNNHINGAGGFAHLGFFNSGKLIRLEYRPYQELFMSEKYNKIAFTHRIRIEERFFRNVSAASIPRNTFNFRFRYQFMSNIEILKLSARAYPILSINAGDEIFINAGMQVAYNLFDQNRILIGPSLAFSKNFLIALEYNSQFASSGSPNSYVHTNVTWLMIRQNFDFSKHKSNGSGD